MESFAVVDALGVTDDIPARCFSPLSLVGQSQFKPGLELLPPSHAVPQGPSWSPAVSTPVSSGHLRPLVRHPMFADLQTSLQSVCTKETVPVNLLTAGHPARNGQDPSVPISVRIGLLQMRFLELEARDADKVHDLHHMYKLQSAKLESDRFNCLQGARSTPWFFASINMYYDHSHHCLMDRVEQSLALVEDLLMSPGRPGVPVLSTPPQLPPATTTLQAECLTSQLHSSVSQPQAPLPPTPRRLTIVEKQQLNPVATRVMSAWYQRNSEHPYPSYETAEVMAKAGNITVEQVKKWFANRRRREGKTKTLTEIAKRRKRAMPEEFLDQLVRKQPRNV